MKDYTVNAITKANVQNKLNDDVYDMFKIYLHIKFHVPAFSTSLLVIDRLQKLKNISYVTHLGVSDPQKISCHATRTGCKVYYDCLPQK
jgi:hypothetical protein